jgi:hypothetical protein
MCGCDSRLKDDVGVLALAEVALFHGLSIGFTYFFACHSTFCSRRNHCSCVSIRCDDCSSMGGCHRGRGCDCLVLAGAKERDEVMSKGRRIDPVATAGATLTFVTTVNYIWVMTRVRAQGMALFRPLPRGTSTYLVEQSNRPLVWVLAVLLGTTALSSYGAKITSPYRRTALLLAGAILMVMGRFAMLSYGAGFTIGVPLFVAGLLCVVAAVWRRRLVMGA